MQRIASVLRTVSIIGLSLTSRNISPASTAFQNTVTTNSLLLTSTPMLNQGCGFKYRGIVRRRCKSCYFVVRDGRMHVICPEKPRHKQKALRPKPINTWILTHASQSKVRPW